MSFLGFIGSRLASYSWMRAFATSEQARRNRSFSGSNLLLFARVSGFTVIVAVAMVRISVFAMTRLLSGEEQL
jgi:hypothetical protein